MPTYRYCEDCNVWPAMTDGQKCEDCQNGKEPEGCDHCAETSVGCIFCHCVDEEIRNWAHAMDKLVDEQREEIKNLKWKLARATKGECWKDG